MITFDTAGERFNVRLRRLGDLEVIEYEPVGMDLVAHLCSGTDVRGPELEEFLHGLTRQIIEAARRAGGGEVALVEAIQGSTLQAFWIGFEMGRGEES